MSVRLLEGDALVRMAEMEPSSIDAVVCDPPYGLSKKPDMVEVLTHWLAGDTYRHGSAGLMGKSWDSFVPGPEYWRAVYRVIKPGAWLVAFAGTRTFDLMSIAIRLAGFTRTDTLMWIHGQGFPKGKGQLKPAWEPIVLARKPAPAPWLNVDGCRLGAYGEVAPDRTPARREDRDNWRFGDGLTVANPAGRWPANVVLSHEPPDEHGNGGCREVGTKRVKRTAGGGYGGSRGRSALPSSYAMDAQRDVTHLGYADADGTETVAAWSCEPSSTEAVAQFILPDGTTVEPQYAALPILAAILTDLVGRLRSIHSEDMRSGRASAPESAPCSSRSRDSQGDCPACCRSCDGLLRQDQVGDRASVRQLADALGCVRDRARLLSSSQIDRSAVHLSSSGDSLGGNTELCSHSSRTDDALSSAPSSLIELASRTEGTALSGQQPSAPRDSTSGSNTDAGDSSSHSIACHSACTDEGFRLLVATSLTCAARFLPVNSDTRIISRAGCPIAMLDAQSGERKSSGNYRPARHSDKRAGFIGRTDNLDAHQMYADTGGASRYFLNLPPDEARFRYCPKASRADRGEGNDWPTVKPQALMRWLCRLICPPGGTILDPFMGSGSTLLAARREGFSAIGIDSDPHAIEIATRRLAEDAGPMFSAVGAFS